ncbi:MAG: RNA polymerase factor sigma-54, partial [Lachnospiraceae bacterium]
YTPSAPLYIRPDVTIVQFKDYFEVLYSDYYLPRVYLSQEYSQLLKSNNDPEVAKYLSDRFRSAKWLMNCISQRRSTLIKCAETILDFQTPFFLGKQNTVSPLSMAEVAQKMNVNISTVSRAVKGKYLQCSRGTFPMSYFFARKLGIGTGTSGDEARHLLVDIIKNEDTLHPFSDRAIAEQMCEKGVTISRRTVAKYRSGLNIPDAYARKTE